jgi:hypothetical protein
LDLAIITVGRGARDETSEVNNDKKCCHEQIVYLSIL